MKVFKGGYKIVSLLNIDITSDFTISGIYDDIKDSHGKPILVSEINVGGEKMNDAYTIVEKSGTSFILKVYGYALTVASTDAVTVAEDVNGVTSIGGVSGEITLGSGLAITEEGELSASGGGGNTLYSHSIKIQGSGADKTGTVGLLFISTSNEQINTAQKLHTALGNNINYSASGYYKATGGQGTIVDISVAGDSHNIYCDYTVEGGATAFGGAISYTNISDVVREIQ